MSWSMNVSPESSTTRNRPRQQVCFIPYIIRIYASFGLSVLFDSLLLHFICNFVCSKGLSLYLKGDSLIETS